MIAVNYQIQLNEAAIFAALTGDPNSAVSYPFIPGSVIRGMMIGRFVQSQRKQDTHFQLDATGEYSHLFFSSQTRYLNAYPIIDGKRSLPVPATWTIPKYKHRNETSNPQEEPEKHALQITDNAFATNQPDNAERRKPKNLSGFTVVDDGTAQIYQPKTALHVHTARARKEAREQQVFRYESLADGQSFMGTILCETDEDAQFLSKLLKGLDWIALGGSRTAEYGGATVLEVSDPIMDWDETKNYQITESVVLTFLSDALLCDEHGAYIPTPKVLQEQFMQMGIDCEVEPINIKTTWVGGFNRKWGLPLPQVMGIERGSVVRLHMRHLNKKAITRLMHHGIGERREDGFGRVVLGWQNAGQATLTYVKLEHQLPNIDPNPIRLDALAHESRQLLETIERRLDDHTIQATKLRVLQDNAFLIRGNISRTQLSRLRTVIANASSLESITTFLTKVNGKVGGRQFDNARITGQSLSEWLENPTFGDNVSRDEATTLQLIDLVLERAYIAHDKQAQKEANQYG